MEEALPIGGWLDPDSPEPRLDQITGSVASTDLDKYESRILGECLVAQRLLSAGHLVLAENNAGTEDPLAKWGHTFSSSVALLAATERAVERDQRRRARLRQRQVLGSQDRWPDLASIAPRTFLLCADHAPPEYGLPSQLYAFPESKELIAWSEFAELVDRLILTVSPATHPAWRKGSAIGPAVATVLYETFKNTHDHARTEVDGADLTNSVRGLFAKFYPLQDALAALSEVPKEQLTPADRYVRGFEPRKIMPGARGTQPPSVSGMLEVSVLDSGPGMAARWLGQPVRQLPAAKQVEAVLACFGKGHSTSGATGRGFGLWKVLHSLAQLRGFISIRTNGVHLFRSFGLIPKDGIGIGFAQEFGSQPLPREFFYDWRRGITRSSSEYSSVRGTVVSFLLPMGTE